MLYSMTVKLKQVALVQVHADAPDQKEAEEKGVLSALGQVNDVDWSKPDRNEAEVYSILSSGGGLVDDERRTLMITQRERDMIIAALRLWQRIAYEDRVDEVEIAVNGREGGDDAHLSDQQIDGLIEERINT